MTPNKVKAAVRARDGFRCTRCGMTDAEHFARYRTTLEVHRVVPNSSYSLEPGVCVTRCKRCHRGEHRKARAAVRLTVDVDAAMPLALRLAATAADLSVQQMANRILRQALLPRDRADMLAQADGLC